MEAIRFSFNDFDLVIDAFDFPGMDGIITVINNAVTMALKHFCKGC
jgi:hypothetical protein